jgi:hypothetical protein
LHFVVNIFRLWLIQFSYHKEKVENEDGILENPSQGIGNAAATTHFAFWYVVLLKKRYFSLSLPRRRTGSY